jgi:ABC-type multidrug transport system fused ATPase/permease subunit
MGVCLLLIYLLLGYLYKHYLYRYDLKKRKSITALTRTFAIITFFSYFLTYFGINVTNALIVFFVAKLLYNITSFYVIRWKGKEREVNHKIESKKLIKTLHEKLDTALDDEEGRKVDLGEEYFYRASEESFYQRRKISVATKLTRFLDIFLIVFYAVVSLILIISLYDGLAKVAQDNILVGVFALLFIYVLNRLYIDIYALYVVVKSNALDIGGVIEFTTNGDRVYGRITEISETKVEVEESSSGATVLLPISLFLNESVKCFGEQTRYFKSFVIGLDRYAQDSGATIKEDFRSLLEQIGSDARMVDRLRFDEDPYFRIVPDDNGVKLVIGYYLLKPETKRMIEYDFEDMLLSKANTIGYDLRTPKLIEIVQEEVTEK